MISLVVMAGCASNDNRPRAVTALTGETLAVSPAPADDTARKQAQLDEACATRAARPDDLDAVIWVGRRQAYLGMFRAAIQTFTDGLAKHPDSPQLLRHRGHRFITVRELDNATRDLARAAELIRGQPDEIEPDGQPNAQNVPLSTLQSNIWYHFGVAEYCRGDWEAALAAFSERVPLAANDDQCVSTAYWRWLCLRRVGRLEDARDVAMTIEPSMTIIENASYFAAMLAVREFEQGGEPAALSRDDAPAALRYAMGIAELTRDGGSETRARAMLAQIRKTTDWVVFVHIAAEADEARLRDRSPATTGRTGGF